MAQTNNPNPNPDDYRPGTSVRVRSSLGRRARGFVVVSWEHGGCRLKRQSDGVVLPHTVPSTALGRDD